MPSDTLRQRSAAACSQLAPQILNRQFVSQHCDHALYYSLYKFLLVKQLRFNSKSSGQPQNEQSCAAIVPKQGRSMWSSRSRTGISV